MRKLEVRGIIEKLQDVNYYRVTKNGHKWIWVSILAESKFVNPLESMICENREKPALKQASKMEEGFRMIDDALTIINNELRLVF